MLHDPYYCEGSMVAHLNALGFESVYNENEDFYERVATKTTPEFDVLVTNPPYSGEHFKRILSLCHKAANLVVVAPELCVQETILSTVDRTERETVISHSGRRETVQVLGAWKTRIRTFNAKGTRRCSRTLWYVEFAGVLDPAEQRAWWLKKYKAHSTRDIPALDDALPQQQRLQKRPNPKGERSKAQGPRRNSTTTTTTTGIYFDPDKAKKKTSTRIHR